MSLGIDAYRVVSSHGPLVHDHPPRGQTNDVMGAADKRKVSHSPPRITPSAYAFTALDALLLLSRDIPEVTQWMCWTMQPGAMEEAIRAMPGKKWAASGKCGKWSWKRVPTSYPELHYWNGRVGDLRIGSGWIGALRIRGPEDVDFILFSYLRQDLLIGKEYLVSTGDLNLLRRFADDVRNCLKATDGMGAKTVQINVRNGPNIVLDAEEDEPIFMDPAIQLDIEQHVDAFCCGGDLYRKMNIPHHRGFLFTGLPGTGKTLMLRRLVRQCHLKYHIGCHSLNMGPLTDFNDLAGLFAVAEQNRPAIIILEDIDCLIRETKVSRSGLLSLLDGLHSGRGTMVLATTNSPERAESSLANRPGRFDRIWTFPLPSRAIRGQYLKAHFPSLEEETLARVARDTADWSIAYLKELRVTAAVTALQAGRKEASIEDIQISLQLLARQFRRARQSHKNCASAEPGAMGFVADDISAA